MFAGSSGSFFQEVRRIPKAKTVTLERRMLLRSFISLNPQPHTVELPKLKAAQCKKVRKKLEGMSQKLLSCFDLLDKAKGLGDMVRASRWVRNICAHCLRGEESAESNGDIYDLARRWSIRIYKVDVPDRELNDAAKRIHGAHAAAVLNRRSHLGCQARG